MTNTKSLPIEIFLLIVTSTAKSLLKEFKSFDHWINLRLICSYTNNHLSNPHIQLNLLVDVVAHYEISNFLALSQFGSISSHSQKSNINQSSSWQYDDSGDLVIVKHLQPGWPFGLSKHQRENLILTLLDRNPCHTHRILTKTFITIASWGYPAPVFTYPDSSILFVAVVENHIQLVKRVLSTLAPNPTDLGTAVNLHPNNRILIRTIKHDNLDMLKLLVEKGNASIHKSAPLVEAVTSEAYNCLEYLIQMGADPCNSEIENAAREACSWLIPRAIEILLDAGIMHVDRFEDSFGGDPLDEIETSFIRQGEYADSSRAAECCWVLALKGADKVKALKVAIKTSEVDVIQRLIDAGADASQIMDPVSKKIIKKMAVDGLLSF